MNERQRALKNLLGGHRWISLTYQEKKVFVIIPINHAPRIRDHLQDAWIWFYDKRHAILPVIFTEQTGLGSRRESKKGDLYSNSNLSFTLRAPIFRVR